MIHNSKKHFFKLEDISLWIEQDSSIHLKAITKFNDPVEMTSEEARELGKTLIAYADILDTMDES